MSYMVITRSDGEYFKTYSPHIKQQFYGHKVVRYSTALKHVHAFKAKGIHAIIKKWT